MKKLLYSECIFLMKVLSKCNRKKQFANGEIAKGDKWGVGVRGMVISFKIVILEPTSYAHILSLLSRVPCVT